MLADRELVIPGRRYKIVNDSGASVTDEFRSASKVIHHLPHDTFVVVAEVRDDDKGAQRVRIGSPAGWIAEHDLESAEPISSLKLNAAAFAERHLQLAPGDNYGLVFPFTFDLLQEFGAEFLTKAFRAAGSIGSDNRVTEIVELKPLASIGASDNAFLTIAYEKPEPGLKTELFVKLPASNLGRKAELSGMPQSEVELHRLSQRKDLPVPVARNYFADYCTYTSNFIVITERIKFGADPIERAYVKGYDHRVPEIEDHYLALTKALALLVTAHKAGDLGYDIEQIFPYGRAARDFTPIANPEVTIDRLIDFISRVAPHLFIPEGTRPDFLAKWREDLLFGLAHKDTVISYLHRDVDYTGFCHPNLNVDNAWFWRDESGELQVGLLDWGGVGQMSIAQAMSGMLMMPPPELYSKLVRKVISTFVAVHADRGGKFLDEEKLLFQYKASVFSTAIGTIIQFCVDALFIFSEDEYRGMQDRFDDRLQNSGLITVIIWVDNMLRDWLDEITPGDACRIIVASANA